MIPYGGEGGIRTPGPVTVNGFQDRRVRPLCHLSISTPNRSRTCNLRIRSALLYPIELWVHFIAVNKSKNYVGFRVPMAGLEPARTLLFKGF